MYKNIGDFLGVQLLKILLWFYYDDVSVHYLHRIRMHFLLRLFNAGTLCMLAVSRMSEISPIHPWIAGLKEIRPCN